MQQSIVFSEEEQLDDVLECGSNVESALLAFFNANCDGGTLGEKVQSLTYQEFPQYFTLKTDGGRKKWEE